MSEPLRILAVECATPRASAAVLHGSRLLSEHHEDGGQHAETLLGLIDGALAEADLRVDALQAFAVSKGPGAFTSLRVGLATIKGLAFGTERPVAGISTLAALAWEVTERQPSGLPVAALLDARRGECYAAVYQREGEALVAVLAPGVYSAAELTEQLPERCHLVGSGADVYAETLRAGVDASRGRLLESGRAPTAGAIGVLAAHALARGEGVLAHQLEPEYLRGANAERPRAAAGRVPSGS